MPSKGFLFLCWIIVSAQASITEAEECGERILLTSRELGLEIFCTKGKQRWPVDSHHYYNRVSYSPRHGGTVAALGEKLKLYLFEQVDTRGDNNNVDVKVIRLRRFYLGDSDFGITDIVLDWVTDIVYVAYFCGTIRACEIRRDFCATVYESFTNGYSKIITDPKGGFIYWTEGSLIRTVGRARMDGTGAETKSYGYDYGDVKMIALDYHTSLLYFIPHHEKNIVQFDFEKNATRGALNLTFVASPGMLTVHGNVLFWEEDLKLFRAEIHENTKNVVLELDKQIMDMEMLPERSLTEGDRAAAFNPCDGSPCSQVCVRASPTTYSCLCSEDYVLHEDGHACLGPQLVISTSEDIFQIPLLATNATSPSTEWKFVPVNASHPNGIACDIGKGRIYWTEKGYMHSRIWEVKISGSQHNPQSVLSWNPGRIRYGTDELETMAVDWITGNLYLAIQGRQRITVCNQRRQAGAQCVELFGNHVASSVGGLALDPNRGLMYWTHQDGDAAIMKGGMDGSRLTVLRKEGVGSPSSIAVINTCVYWVDTARQRIEFVFAEKDIHGFLPASKYQDLVPQHIVIYKDELYWTGMVRDGSYEAVLKRSLSSFVDDYVVGNFSRVTGLSGYGHGFQGKFRKNDCADGGSCAGICLLSGPDSFRCLCPTGFEFDGVSCRVTLEPAVIYATSDQSVMLAQGRMNATLLSHQTSKLLAYDPMNKEIFWFDYKCGCQLGDHDCDGFSDNRGCVATLYGVTLSGKKTMTRMELFRDDLARPLWLEYDWLGENIFFVGEKEHNIYLCSRKDLHCKTVVYRSETVKFAGGERFALDPPNGQMYWFQEKDEYSWSSRRSGIWKGALDGSDQILLIPDVKARLVTVGHSSQSLFWVVSGNVFGSEHFHEVFHSDLDGKSSRRTVRLGSYPTLLRVQGERLFWMDNTTFPRIKLISCHQENANDLRTHGLLEQPEPEGSFFALSHNFNFQAPRDSCHPDGPCSHMCVPTHTGYMKCACPDYFELQPNGWTCQCEYRRMCNATSASESPGTVLRYPHLPKLGRTSTGRVICPGNKFHCVGKCLDMEKICNGLLDCPDFSDEGERCNEVCTSDNHGCSHNCSRSPTGPLCLCPPDQILDTDNKTCILIQVQNEEGASASRLTVSMIATGAVGFAVVSVVVIVVSLKYRQAKRKLSDLTEMEVQGFLQGDPAGAAVAPDGADKALLLPYIHVLSPTDIIIASKTVLGSGEFGIVHPGIYKLEPVAIKLFKRSAEIDEFKSVLAELKIMAYLGSHDHIIKFVGADVSEIAQRKITVVTELSLDGDLLRFLWKVSAVGLETGVGAHANEGASRSSPAGVTAQTLYSWCGQIANGMAYLAQKQIVHGDLASRNILVFKEHTLKISDFGLSKSLYGSQSYAMKRKRKLPWRAASVELLTSSEFSEGSDVWAFGVTAWEIFTLGQTPYKGKQFGKQFIQFLLDGNRLPRPGNVSEQTYNALLRCWDAERDNRPNFQMLEQIFHDLPLKDKRSVDQRGTVLESQYVTAV